MSLQDDILKKATEKLAANAWKERMYSGNLSEGAQSKLENSGVLNREKLLSGIETGNENLIKRLGLTVEKPDMMTSLQTGGFAAEPWNRKIYVDPDSILLHPEGPMAGLSDKLMGTLTHSDRAKMDEALSKIPTPLRELIESKLVGGRGPKDPTMTKERMQKEMVPVLKRHEIDEVRAYDKAKKKGKTTSFKDIGKNFYAGTQELGHVLERLPENIGKPTMEALEPGAQAIGAFLDQPAEFSGRGLYSHLDPSVLANESMNLHAIPSASLRDYMSNLRASSGEAATLGDMGISYGGARRTSMMEKLKGLVGQGTEQATSRKGMLDAASRAGDDIANSVSKKLFHYAGSPQAAEHVKTVASPIKKLLSLLGR